MAALFATPLGALLIFGLRVVDVSLATLRMIFSVRGYRWLCAGIGFVEVLIWVVAAGHTLQHLDSVLHLVCYAGGFGAGSYVGVWLEGRFALGYQIVRAIYRRPDAGGPGEAPDAAAELRARGFAVTEVSGRGRDDDVGILEAVVRRRDAPGVVSVLEAHLPGVFLTVEELRSVHGGTLRPAGRKAPALARS